MKFMEFNILNKMKMCVYVKSNIDKSKINFLLKKLYDYY